MTKQSYNTHREHRKCQGYQENLARLREFVVNNKRREGSEFYNKLSYESRKELKKTKEGSNLVKALSVSC